MISAATIAALGKRQLEYILGARERSSVVVRRLVLEDDCSLAGAGRDPALRPRGQGRHSALRSLPQSGRSGAGAQ
jgi:hypothetical protein